MIHGLTTPSLDHTTRDVSRGDDGVIGFARNMQSLKLTRHNLTRTRRIGDQDHYAAVGAHAHQCVAGMRKGGEAVVYYAPDVAEQRVVTGRKGGELRDQGR